MYREFFSPFKIFPLYKMKNLSSIYVEEDCKIILVPRSLILHKKPSGGVTSQKHGIS